MNKNFKEEIDLINKNDQIKEKLLTMEVYNSFYNSILECLPAGNPDVIEYYESILKDTFKTVISELSLQEKTSVDARQFMRAYIRLFGSKCIGVRALDGVIVSFNNSFGVDSPLFDDKLVKVIDSYETIPFDKKVEVIIQFDDYMRDVYHKLNMHLNKETGSRLKPNISAMLLAKLRDYLAKDNGLDVSAAGLKAYMMSTTKDYLMNELNNGSLGFDSFNENITEACYNFSEPEQKFWLVVGIYNIAFDDERYKSKESTPQLLEDLGLSADEYVSMAKSVMGKIRNTLMSNLSDDDSPKRG